MLMCDIFFSLSGLSREGPVTDPTTVERDPDSHQPLMSDNEEEENEVVCDGGYYSIQKQDDEPEPQTKAIGFFQAFCLPGVIPVSQILNFVCYPEWALIYSYSSEHVVNFYWYDSPIKVA